MYTPLHTQIHSHTCPDPCTDTHTLTLTNTLIHIPTQAHACTHAHMHTNTPCLCAHACVNLLRCMYTCAGIVSDQTVLLISAWLCFCKNFQIFPWWKKNSHACICFVETMFKVPVGAVFLNNNQTNKLNKFEWDHQNCFFLCLFWVVVVVLLLLLLFNPFLWYPFLSHFYMYLWCQY